MKYKSIFTTIFLLSFFYIRANNTLEEILIKNLCNSILLYRDFCELKIQMKESKVFVNLETGENKIVFDKGVLKNAINKFNRLSKKQQVSILTEEYTLKSIESDTISIIDSMNVFTTNVKTKVKNTMFELKKNRAKDNKSEIIILEKISFKNNKILFAIDIYGTKYYIVCNFKTKLGSFDEIEFWQYQKPNYE